MPATRLQVLVLTGFVSACTLSPHDSAAPLSAVGGLAGPAAVHADSPPDISGTWQWNNAEVLRFPSFVAVMVGVQPEGPSTHARCQSAGTMILLQNGSSFTGQALRTSNSCVTNGGQSFQQPGSTFQVADGQIRGRSIHFSFSSPPISPCPHRAAISELQASVATALAGTGRCVLPGHPQSDSPLQLDPPPGGTSVTIEWSATRQ